MAQPGTDQHESRVAVRETAYYTGAASDLPVQPFNDIVGADTGPVLTGKIAVGQSLINAVLHLLSGLLQFHGTEFFYHGFGLFTGCFLALLGMDRLEHLGYQLYLGAWRNGEHIAVKVDGTPLVFGLRKHLSHGFQHTETLVAKNKFHTVQTTATQPLEEADPAGFVLLHTLCGAQNLTISVLIDRNRHQNSHIFKLSTPVAAQVDPIHIDIRIPPTLQRTVPPIFNVDIRFLIQLTDGGWRNLAAPEGLGDVLHTPDGYASQVHFNKSLFHAALPAAIPLNDGSLKGDSLELGYLEGDIPGSGGEVAVIVAAAVALALLVAFIPGCLGQLLCLSLQQLVERLLYTASYQFLELPLDNFFV